MDETAPAPPEIVTVDSPTVACDGNGDPSGHPRVFLHLGDRGQVDCPYCGRRFLRPGFERGGGRGQ